MATASVRRGRTFNSYELLFSLTLGLGVVGIALVHDLLLWPFATINRAVTPVLIHHGGLNLAADIAFVATALMYTAFLWLLLRSSAASPLAHQFLCSWSIAVLFVAPWFCWIMMAGGRSLVADMLLTIETAIGTFSALYLPRRTHGLSWQITLIGVTHWSLWSWLFWRAIPSHAATLIPAIGGVSFIAWFLSRASDVRADS